MKKLLCFAIIVTVILSFTACDSDVPGILDFGKEKNGYFRNTILTETNLSLCGLINCRTEKDRIHFSEPNWMTLILPTSEAFSFTIFPTQISIFHIRGVILLFVKKVFCI